MASTSSHVLHANSTRRRHRWAALFILGSLILGSVHAQVTIGNSLIDGTANDGNSGGVYIYTGTFGQAGVADSWAFFDNDAGNGFVTPLLFHKIDSSIFQLTAVGTSVQTNNGGAQTGLNFGLILGSTVVGADYTFGFTDRILSYGGSGTDLTTGSTNSGVIDFNTGGIWGFVPSAQGSFSISLGQNFEIGAPIDGDDTTVSLWTVTDRAYSAQFTVSAVPEPGSAALWAGWFALFAVGFNRTRRKPACARSGPADPV